jgi:hypothetical protein
VINDPNLGLVDYRVLQKPTGHLDLLADLVNGELRDSSPADAVVFLGPRCRFLEKMPAELLEAHPGAYTRFFYLQYRTGIPPMTQAGMPDDASSRQGGLLRGGGVGGPSLPDYVMDGDLPDSIGSAVARLKGRTFVVHSPGEFDKAIRLIERPM